MKIIERLNIYIEHKGISLNSFDKSIGTANGYIGKQIKNNASLGADIIEKIVSKYTDLSIEWLITGKGEMINSKSTPDKDPPGNYNSQALITTLQELVETQKRYIERLENDLNETENEPASNGQKRKAG